MRRKRDIIYATTWKVGLMHRFLMNPPSGLWVDHINRVGIDNRRTNLRIATPSQNQSNRKKRTDSKSKFKGIYWRSNRKTWVATIQSNGKTFYLGSSKDEARAAKLYDDAAKKLFGDFACGSTSDA